MRLDRLAEIVGKTVVVDGQRVRCDPPIRLPCRRCGRLTEIHGPREARTCATCRKGGLSTDRLKNRFRRHVTGALANAFHVEGRPDPDSAWPVLCDHPDCVTVFWADHYEKRGCPAHEDRMKRSRAHQRQERPKRARFAFYADEGVVWEAEGRRVEGVRVGVTLVGGETRDCEITRSGYVARDDAEFQGPRAHGSQ